MNNNQNLEKLNNLFGSYKAEWLRGQIFELFTEPAYFPELKDIRPCVLEGGRGTGKTTVLRGLSYQGQYALQSENIIEFDKNSFIGLYQKINTNHVRAFKDGGLSENKWEKIFAHYFNLIICREVLVFLIWHNKIVESDSELVPSVCHLIANSLNISDECGNQEKLLYNINDTLVKFQAKINNVNEGDFNTLSLSGVPIAIITENVLSLPQFKNKIFFLLLDEYENFEDYQQRVLNSLIKHTTEYYTFKIGVRELGWRIKCTLNPDELLYDPADYVLIKIEKEFKDAYFAEFAKKVCRQRIIQLLLSENQNENYDVEYALQGMSIEYEADLLGIEDTELLQSIKSISSSEFEKIQSLPNLYLYLIAYWAKWHNMSIIQAINDYISSSATWNQRYDNYKYELLFKIRKGRGKGGIQKYYSGWKTYVKLASGNIRYLMQLIYLAYEKHLNENNLLTTPVSTKIQTLAAQEVGEKNLIELEGLTKNGAQLIKLLLGLGRIFNVLSSEEGKFAPEQNQFSIENSESISTECKDIMDSAVMHLALIRSPGNKLTDSTHTRDYIYSVHPIFAAFFVFSHRKKRKIILNQEDILGVISSPKESIRSILKKCSVSFDENAEKQLPEQLTMFEDFYNDER